jgi:hypothetical protein
LKYEFDYFFCTIAWPTVLLYSEDFEAALVQDKFCRFASAWQGRFAQVAADKAELAPDLPAVRLHICVLFLSASGGGVCGQVYYSSDFFLL